MENGVQNLEKPILDEEEKAADGGVSQLKLVEDVVQVIHESKEADEEMMRGDGGGGVGGGDEDSQLKLERNVVGDDERKKEDDGVDRLESKGDGAGNVETKTAAGEVSQLKLVEDVHVFHESKDSEGDDVFEEAMTDVHPEEGNLEKSDSKEVTSNGDDEHVKEIGDSGALEVNGSFSESHDGEKFEEAVDSVVSDDQSFEGETPVAVEEELEAVVYEKPIDEVRAQDGGVDDGDQGDEKVEQMGSSDSLVVNVGSSEADQFEEALETGLPGDRSSHTEEPTVVEEQLQASADAQPFETVRVADLVVDENVFKSILAPETLERGFEQGDVNEHSTVAVDGERISSSNGEVEPTGSSDATVNDKSENGDLDKFSFEQKPNVPAKPSGVDQVSPDENGLAERNESGEKNLGQADQISETKDSTTNVVTSVTNEPVSPKAVGVSSNLGAPVNEETIDREIKSLSPLECHDTTPDERVVSVSAKVEVKDDQNNQPPDISEKVDNVSDNHSVAEKPEVEEIQNQEPDSSSVEQPANPSLTRKQEIQPGVEPAQPPPRPAGLGGAAPLLDPAPRAMQQSRVNGALPQRQAQLVEDPLNGEAEENDETREKLQMIRVKFLRLAHRLGQTPHNVVVAQVLYRLGLAEQLRGRNAGRAGAFSFDRASAMAEQIEAAGQEPLDFSCTIMVLGKTGVGKSATINSIFDEVKFSTDAFQMGTKKVQDVVGTVQGIKVRVIDTPGLLPCWSDQRLNEKILHSVKRFIKKNPPDIVLYLDRLDMQSRDFGDLPLLRTITEIFGPSIWFNAIVVLTHAASAPPDGPNGVSSSYEMFVTQRSHVVQQAIRQAAGDMRLMNPVSLVENHSACRTNRAGQRVLPNGQVWKPHLLLLSFASKILAEANTLLKLQDGPPGKPFATRSRVPPLPFLLSSLLQSRPQLKLPEEQLGDEDDLDEDLDDSSDSDGESDYDELPPFKRLTKAQLAKLSKAQKKAYFDELEYREKLFMKKQLRDEKRRRRLLKKMAASAKDVPNEYTENAEEESGGAATVPVAMPDFTLPASFDSDNPTHRYRFLDTSNQWLVRPVLETHGWDHDVGYEGINVERLFVVKDKIPLSFSGQVTKDKKESNLQMEVAGSIKHNEGKATSVGFDMQTVGKDMAYTLRSETRFSNYRRNKTAAGLSVTLLGDALTAGVKLEDRLIVNKRFRLVLTGGAMTGRGDVAYGGSLEATLRDKDYPLGRALSTLGLSIMDWHGDLAIGCNVQSQIPIGRTTNLVARANLNNRGSGQISLRLNSSEQLQIALVALLPLLRKISAQYQQMMYGE